MELKLIEALLGKYLNGETSVQEEGRLRSYFTSGNVAPHLQEYVPLFSYFCLAKQESISKEPDYSSDRKKTYSWAAVAASIIILLGVVVQQNEGISEYGTYEDPELAMQKTREALEMVGSFMNNGAEDLGYLQEFNNTKEKIVRTLK